MTSGATIAIFPSRHSPYVVLDVERVRAAMDGRGVSADELASRAGVGVAVVSRILRAKPVRRRTAALVIRAILVSPELDGMAGFLSDTTALAG